MEPRVLLTSFPEFGGHEENISKKIMLAFESTGVRGIKLETELLTCDEDGSRRVSNLIQQGEKYDAIIQLGLAESRNKISLERWAHNHSKFRIPDNSGRMVEEIIIERGPEKYQTTVSKHILDEEFENDEDIVWSNSAGQFVCNETIYRTLNSIELMGGKIPAIFIHLPQESEISFTRQMEVISRIIKTLASKPRLEVVGALLFNPERRILACRRPPQDVWAGWWEFPGGKIDEGETEKEALRREIMEELGIIVNPKSRVAALQYEYEDRFVSLSIWDCGVVDQESIVTKEHDLISWLDQSSLNTVKWLPADEPLIEEWMKSGIPYS
ncbi:MAG: NUDIX domain-containing protein [Candidatus Thalassarchaeaceae archaeon]